MSYELVDAEVWPEGGLEILSQFEVDQLQSSGSGGLYPLLRRCMLAVLNADSYTDDARQLLDTYRDFEIGFIRQDRGLKVTLKNAPPEAFVDGKMIRGTRELLSAVLRDIVFARNDVFDSGRFDLGRSDDVTNAVFHIVRNARLLTLPACLCVRRHGDALHAIARATCARLGERGLFLAPEPERLSPSTPDFATFGFTPLGTLLPRCRAIVHHGGIGTTGEVSVTGDAVNVAAALEQAQLDMGELFLR
mgnify:CR=1 FL=1